MFAASACIALVALTSLSQLPIRQLQAVEKPLQGSIATQLGQHRCEALPDGSQVCLNTQSEVRYSFSQSARTVELVSGEASFTVQHEERTFDVVCGGLRVHDVGTSFDVYRRRDSTLITVIQGSVGIASPAQHAPPLQLSKFEQVEFLEGPGTFHVRPPLTEEGLSQFLAWQRGRIDLNDRTLADILEEFARYQPIGKIIIPEKPVREFTLGGELDATHLMDFLDSLEVLHHIHHWITTAPDGQMTITLYSQQGAPDHLKQK